MKTIDMEKVTRTDGENESWTEKEITGTGFFMVKGDDGLYGIADCNHKTIIDCVYDKIEVDDSFSPIMFRVEKLGDDEHTNIGYISAEGKVILPCECFAIEVDRHFNPFMFRVDKIKDRTIYCGVFSAEGKEILPCEYDEIKVEDCFSPCLFIVEKMNDDEEFKKGVFSAEGKEILPCEYYDIEADDSFSPCLLKVQKGTNVYDTKVGYFNAEGKVIVPCEYDDAYAFRRSDVLNLPESSPADNKYIKVRNGFVGICENINVVKDRGANGIYDTDGNVVLPCEYRILDHGSKENFVIVNARKWLCGVADENFNILIPTVYEGITPFFEGFAMFQRDDEIGFVDMKGKEYVYGEYDEPEGLQFDSHKYTDTACLDGNYDLIYEFLERDRCRFCGGLIPVCKDGKYGYLNTRFEEAIPLRFKSARSFKDGIARVVTAFTNQFGVETIKANYIDTEGNEIFPYKYDDIERYEDDCTKFFAARKGASFAIIDMEGHEYLPLGLYKQCMDGNFVLYEHKKVKDFYVFTLAYNLDEKFPKFCFVVIKNDKSVLLLDNNSESYIGSYFKFYYKGCVMNLEGKWGLADDDMNIIIDCKYKGIRGFCNGFAAAKKTQWGFIDKDGKPLCKFEYTDVDDFYGGYAVVKKGKMFGLLNTSGELVEPCIYDKIDWDCGVYKLHKKGKKIKRIPFAD